MDNGDIESAEEEFPAQIGGRKYRPVVANDRAVLEMSSMEPGSSSAVSATFSDRQASLKYILSLSLSLHVYVRYKWFFISRIAMQLSPYRVMKLWYLYVMGLSSLILFLHAVNLFYS